MNLGGTTGIVSSLMIFHQGRFFIFWKDLRKGDVINDFTDF